MDKETVWNVVLIFGIVLFFVAVGLALIEFYGAISFCHSQEGDYSFSFKEVSHYCNKDKIIQYKTGWDHVKSKTNLTVDLDSIYKN